MSADARALSPTRANGPFAPGHAPTLDAIARAAVASHAVPQDAGDVPELAALTAYRGAIGDGSPPAIARALERALAAPAPADAPLVALSRALPLSRVEVLAVALAAAVEDDLLLGRAIARLQAPVGGSRPTVGLVSLALADVDPAEPRPTDALLGGRALATGVLTLTADGAPLPERGLGVPLHLCVALRDRDGSVPGVSLGDATVALPPSVRDEAARQARALDGSTGDGRAGRRVLVLRTGSRAEGGAVAAALAAALGRRPAFLDGEPPPGIGPWLVLRALLPVLHVELAPGERRQLPALPGYDGPVVAVSGPDGSIEAGDALVVTWTLAVPTRAERAALWREALRGPNSRASMADALARDHRHGAGRIAHLGRLAEHRAALRASDAPPSAADLRAAAWSMERGGFEALAQPVADDVPADALVTTDTLRAELEMLLQRCRARDELTTGLGAAAVARYHPGVRALLVGPSGTGKTLAAAWLATRLALPLYRVDLASVTSKYIGETEKNLAQLLARAEQAEVVLLFDEADSLFGKRTDVKDANDRFANAQTNYLLQRIETFDGIVLLTSNSRSRFDSAFARRLDQILEFTLPGPEERRALWQAHLGTAHGVTSRDVNRLAARVDLAGGHVRGAVLSASVLARADDRPIELRDVVRGVAAEYRKLGRQMPAELLAGG